jgi:hypothetical protein
MRSRLARVFIELLPLVLRLPATGEQFAIGHSHLLNFLLSVTKDVEEEESTA